MWRSLYQLLPKSQDNAKLKRFIILTFLLLLHSLVIATTYTISLDGTGDFTEIQDGINASIDGDTVLVYPGTYYENINYNGKNIGNVSKVGVK